MVQFYHIFHLVSLFLKFFLLFIIGISAGFINVNAGGGSTITLPALIFMGLSGSVANGTNRIGILIQNISAVSSFKRRDYSDFKRSLIMALFTLPGAIGGAFLSVQLTDDWFRRILAMIIILVVLSMILIRPKKEPVESARSRSRWLIYPAMLGIGFYGGFIQAGVGFLFMASLFHILKLSLARVNMHKVFIVGLYTIPALLIFILTGNVNWGYGALLASGMALGGWWGAHVSIRGGEKAIKGILMVALIIMALKLLKII
jgi:uncharacterized membrane protein YfcA